MSKKTAQPVSKAGRVGRAKAGKPSPKSATTVIDSAQQIWAAGLAAYDKARGKRNKAFEKLVQDGLVLQKKAQIAVNGTVAEVGEKASEQWDKLEGMFERRVADALTRLGVPNAVDFAGVSKKLDALAQAVGIKKAAPAKAVKKAAAKKPAAKPVAKKPVAKKAAAKPAVKAAAKKAVAKPAAKKVAKKVAAKPAAKKVVAKSAPATK